jgi:hypothetical protein
MARRWEKQVEQVTIRIVQINAAAAGMRAEPAERFETEGRLHETGKRRQVRLRKLEGGKCMRKLVALTGIKN